MKQERIVGMNVSVLKVFLLVAYLNLNIDNYISGQFLSEVFTVLPLLVQYFKIIYYKTIIGQFI